MMWCSPTTTITSAANAERSAIQQQLLGILEAGNAAGLWQLPAPKVTASLIYAGVHGATDDLIAAPAPDADAFIAAVQADCLRMVGVQPTGAKRR